MEEAQARGGAEGRTLIARALEMHRIAWRKGRDAEHGGIFCHVGPNGGEPPPCAKDGEMDFGERWDDKVWWAHGEALYSTALATFAGDGPPDTESWRAFEELHAYTQSAFVNAEHKEWFAYLARDGTPHARFDGLGSWIKCFFHVPRALLRCARLFEREAAAAASSKKRRD